MKERYEMRLSGAGGQGLVVAGLLLGEAATLFDGKNAVQTQSYGIASRGGYSKSEIIISSDPIYCPHVLEPDLVLALTEEAYSRSQDLKPGSLLLYDNEAVSQPGQREAEERGFPFCRLSREMSGGKCLNIITLGLVVSLTGVVSREALEGAVIKRFPSFKEMNLKALEKGFLLAE